MESLHPDADRSLREMAGRLERIAAGGPFGAQIAHLVTRRYRDALGNHPDEQIREHQWRNFFVALHTFLVLHGSNGSRDLSILHSLLDENSDIIQRDGSRSTTALVGT